MLLAGARPPSSSRLPSGGSSRRTSWLQVSGGRHRTAELSDWAGKVREWQPRFSRILSRSLLLVILQYKPIRNLLLADMCNCRTVLPCCCGSCGMIVNLPLEMGCITTTLFWPAPAQILGWFIIGQIMNSENRGRTSWNMKLCNSILIIVLCIKYIKPPSLVIFQCDTYLFVRN